MNNTLQGQLHLPGDKSVSHRALMLLGIAKGSATVSNLSSGQDVLSTLKCMQQLGCTITPTGDNQYRVDGQPRLQTPDKPLDCGNSGTTIRLLSGLLAGAGIAATLTGDESLSKRPMSRVLTPLTQMGASITAQGTAGCAPLQIHPVASPLHGIEYTLPMASAQVKSAVLLAGLFVPPGEAITVIEPFPSRDHTERMLNALGATVTTQNNLVQLIGRHTDLVVQDILVPGDISSAAFWLVGAGILPGSSLVLKNVGLNPSRTGLLTLLQDIGMEIVIKNLQHSAGEPYGDIHIHTQPLTGDLMITPEMVPSVIDEIPILTILGLFTDGQFTVRGAEELRYKESDRLGALISLLKTLQVDVESDDDGFSFQGSSQWQVPEIQTAFETHHDHRLVMALEILNLRAKTPLRIQGKEWAAVSYPTFFETLNRLFTCDSQVSG